MGQTLLRHTQRLARTKSGLGSLPGSLGFELQGQPYIGTSAAYTTVSKALGYETGRSNVAQPLRCVDTKINASDGSILRLIYSILHTLILTLHKTIYQEGVTSQAMAASQHGLGLHGIEPVEVPSITVDIPVSHVVV